MRGFGGVQSGFAIESHMDLLAKDLGIDAVEFRLRNITTPNMTTVNKMLLTTNGLKECIERSVVASDWNKKRGNPDYYKTGLWRRGIGIGIAADVMGSKMYKSHESAGAIVKVEEDGSVYLFTGAADTGQGSNTALTQIAAQALGVKYERFKCKSGDTEITPFDTGSFASRVTFISGNAALRAGKDAKMQILEIVAKEHNLPIENLDIVAEKVINLKNKNQVLMTFDEALELCYSFNYGRQIIGRGSYNPKTTPVDFRTGEGNVSGSYGFEAQVAEVAVNIESGEIQIIKMWDAHDIGKAINPQSVEAQIEGSLAMGIGYTFYEDLQFRNGRIVNANFANYRLPRLMGMPPMETILVETDDPEGPFGAKGMGEASLLPTSAAIANAIEDAVGVRIKHLPITPAKIIKALKEKNNASGETKK
jgi:4-hydroxybenzoyl-CoA reductase subunit alpha